MNFCRLCGAQAGFVKSHIIPEAFFRQLRDEEQKLLLVADAAGYFPKNAPIGVYDGEILCKLCEAKFLAIDTYGIDALLTRFDWYFQPIVNDNGPVAYESASVDTLKLLEFLVAIIWRGSISRQPFFRTLALGPHEESAKAGLFATSPVIPKVFDAVLSRWEDTKAPSLPKAALLNPHRERWGDINAYRLYLGKVVAYVKVDQRPFLAPFATFSLRTGLPCRIISRRLAPSNDIIAMRKTIGAAERNRQQLLAKRRTT
ncbi:MAG: hypothetical protein NT159_06140 [Proteobacteria bacterium]|nr:hypothetical protein [Pseudomonadota bacterium]